MLRRAPSTALRTASDTSFALPVAKPTLALTIADGDERVEGEAASALHDLGDAVDRDHVLDELAATVAASAVAIAALPPSPPPRPPR